MLDARVHQQMMTPLNRSTLSILTLIFAASLGSPKPTASAQTGGVGSELTLDQIFPTDRVLDVRITVADEDWDTIRKQSRNLFEVLQEKRKLGPIEGSYTYVDASVTIDGVTFPKVGLRKKGFIGSQGSSRPSLKIKLNHVDKEGGIEGWASLTGQVDAAKVLIENGARVDEPNRDGGVPLHSAAFLGNAGVVDLLIQRGAVVNAKNGMGETPLGIIADPWNEGTEGIVRFIASLVKIQVDMERVKAGRPEAAAILRKHGGKRAAELR